MNSTKSLLFFSSGDWISTSIATGFFPTMKSFYWRFEKGVDICRYLMQEGGDESKQHTFFLHSFVLPFPILPGSLLSTEHLVSPSSLREIYACSLLRSSSVLSSSRTSFSLTPSLSVHSGTQTQISSDALSADYSLFMKKEISYDKLWYNVILFCHFYEPTV